MKFPSLIGLALPAALGLGLLLLPAAHAQNAGDVRVVRLSRAEGQVLVSHAGSDVWEEAPVNFPLQEGDTLATQDGLAGIEFENGATGFLAENSVLQFSQLGFSGAGRATELTLTQGAGTFDANLTGQDSFRVHTSTFDVTVPEQAEFRIDAFRDGASAEVFTGKVSVSTTKGSTDLETGQSVAVHENDFQDLYRGRLPNPDPFDQWVIQEGERIRAGNKNTLSYISPPNTYGLSELSVYGTWVNFAEFGGFVWRPFSVGLSWTPYFNGTWRLDPLLGWIWVSGEPWGWMPYHFGSWLLSPVLGWVWVPGGPAGLRQWQGARVNWVQTGTQIGWVAMSPKDRNGVPANAAHGVITTSSQMPRNGIKLNQVISGKDLRNATPLKLPPHELAANPATASPALGTRSTIRIAPRTRSSGEPAIPDHESRAVFKGSNPPVTGAAVMPKPGAETPRVTKPQQGPADSRVNRDFPPLSHLPTPTPAPRTSVPAYGANPVRPPMSPPPVAPPHPVEAPRPITPPLTPRPVAPASPPAQPPAPHAAPPQKNSEAHPATQTKQPASPQAAPH